MPYTAKGKFAYRLFANPLVKSGFAKNEIVWYISSLKFLRFQRCFNVRSAEKYFAS